MPPKFGTSGLRGLVTDLTPELVGQYVMAFAETCPIGRGIFVGRDLRPSSEAIASDVCSAARALGLTVTDCNALPTPALALAAMKSDSAAIMITGSHIPADRNGLKFYTPQGEITKSHEASIVDAVGTTYPITHGPAVGQDLEAGSSYVARYVNAYGSALTGLSLGVYSHSAVSRDILIVLLRELGAQVRDLGRSDTFIPVDTEAVDQEVRDQLRVWTRQHKLDAILSTDGDGDRPMFADEFGDIVPGDILGQITAQSLDARIVVTPVSSNTGVEFSEKFDQVVRTRIGSPHVIAAMEDTPGHVVGYEANGGFLVGFDAQGAKGKLPALMTRDAFLPIVAVLVQSVGTSVSQLVARQPSRYTASDRIQNVPLAQSQAAMGRLTVDLQERARFLSAFSAQEAGLNQTDGLRMTLNDNRIVHLRPSGNAPELRIYIEADSPSRAQASLAIGLHELRALLASV